MKLHTSSTLPRIESRPSRKNYKLPDELTAQVIRIIQNKKKKGAEQQRKGYGRGLAQLCGCGMINPFPRILSVSEPLFFSNSPPPRPALYQSIFFLVIFSSNIASRAFKMTYGLTIFQFFSIQFLDKIVNRPYQNLRYRCGDFKTTLLQGWGRGKKNYMNYEASTNINF